MVKFGLETCEKLYKKQKINSGKVKPSDSKNPLYLYMFTEHLYLYKKTNIYLHLPNIAI